MVLGMMANILYTSIRSNTKGEDIVNRMYFDVPQIITRLMYLEKGMIHTYME
ncbi:MAG: hypothetical protein JRI58_07180 [Deltaproteobacteria bacterium]|nr:hypothetical protein [Deltaproteobacteria bacterium]